MSDVAIEVRGLGKRYEIGADQAGYLLLTERITERLKSLGRGQRTEEFWALRDVDFEVKRGETMGIVGHNGAGKSTLLKILSRITPPTEGEARLRGRVGALLEVGTGFHPELTGRENVFLNGAILDMRRAGDPAEVRRDRRVRRRRALHRHPGEALLERDADAARVLGRRPPRARDPDHRRGPLGRGPRLSGEVPGADGDRGRRGADRRLHQPQPRLRSRPLRPGDHALGWANRRPRQRLARWSTPTSATCSRSRRRASGIARTGSATGGCRSTDLRLERDGQMIDSPASGKDFDIVVSFETARWKADARRQLRDRDRGPRRGQAADQHLLRDRRGARSARFPPTARSAAGSSAARCRPASTTSASGATPASRCSTRSPEPPT